MFVGCSEIRVSVTVKHVQHIRIITAFCMPVGGLVKFFSAREDTKNQTHVKKVGYTSEFLFHIY